MSQPTIKKSTNVKATGGKKKDKKKVLTSARLVITAMYNNTIVAITDLSGNVVTTSSCGRFYKNSKKSTPHATQVVLKNIVDALGSYGINTLQIEFNGNGPARDMTIFLQGIQTNGITVTSIKDNVSVPYNGTRQRRAKRN
jgi:small subunit ribosomal protein S11